MEKDGVTYYNVYTESKQGRIGAMTNAISGTDQMERTENWSGFDFTPYVTEGFAQKIVEPDNGTTIDIFYKSASEYRVIFNTDDTYIPRVQANLNDTLKFDYSGEGSLTIQDTGGNSHPESKYKNPVRTGYKFDGWRYEVVENSGISAAYEEGGKHYVNIGENGGSSSTGDFKIDEELVKKTVIVLANDNDSTVKAIHLYPRWSPADANVRVVFWTEDLSGGAKDVDVDITASAGDYENRVRAYLNGTPETVGDSFSNLGSFTFRATAEQKLNLSVDSSKKLTTSITQSFTVTDHALSGGSTSGTLADIIDTMFDVRMPKVTTSDPDNREIGSSQFYYPYHINRGSSAEVTVEADGSTVINVYYARNVYKVDYTYYGTAADGNLSVATNTVGYSDLDNPADYSANTSYTHNGATYTNQYRAVVNSPSWTVPEKITIAAKYGADIRDVWPNSENETISLQNVSGRNNSATFVSWGTTAGPYNAKFKKDRIESTLMGIYSAMSADIIANPADPDGTTHHMYGYWWDGSLSYYRFNHCYEVPNLTTNQLLAASDSTYAVTNRSFGNSGNANEMTGVSTDETTRRNTIYLVRINGSLHDYFDDYQRVLMKVNASGEEEENGQYYAVRCFGNHVYAVARQVNAPSSNRIEAQNPSARMNMTRVNDTADHDTRTVDSDGIYNVNPIGSSSAPYDLFFYYNRNRFTITYMVPARESSTGEYTLGTREVPFGSSLKRYRIDFENDDKKLYSNNDKFDWTASGVNSGLGAGVNADGFVRVAPDSAAEGTGTWTFAGWALDRADSQRVQEDDWIKNTISGNLRLFAIWKPPVYKVTFKMDGGVLPGGSSDDVIYGDIPANQGFTSSGKSIPRPTKNGYILSGWDWYRVNGPTENDRTLDSDFTFESPIIQDMVAIAKWDTFQAKSYSYKVWYLTNDPGATRESGDGWVSEEISGEPGTNANPPAGLDGISDYTHILGCKFFSNQKYPEGTTLLLGAESFDGYIPYNGNAAIELNRGENYREDATDNEDAGNTRYVAYFYYNKAVMKKYTIQFQPVSSDGRDDGDVLDDIKQEGETDRAYFTPNEETFEALRNAGYQLVQVDENGDVIKGADGKPIAAKNVGDLKDFIDAQNEKFAGLADGAALEVVFKVMPIPYTIDYGVGTLTEGNNKQGIKMVIEDPDLDTLEGVMQAALNKLEGGEVWTAVPAGKNPTGYDVSYFRGSNGNFDGSFTLKAPLYVQNPNPTRSNVPEYWKFTGWSLGENTTANTSAVAGEYPSLEVEHSVGDLIFLANWERVPAALTVTNRVTTKSGVKIPDEDFEYTITLPGGVNAADLIVYKTDAAGNVTEFVLPANGRFTLKNDETISIAGLTGAYTVTQTITGDKFDSTKEKYYTYTGASIDNRSVGVNNNVGSSLGGENLSDDVIFNNVYVATVDLDTDPGATGNQGFPVTKYLLENGTRRNFFGGNNYEFLIRPGAQSAPGIDTPVPGSVTLRSTAGADSLSGHFDSVRFTQPGTYTYVISEARPTANGVPGVSYDPTMYRITVRVAVSENEENLVVTIVSVESRTTADTSDGGTDGWRPVTGGAANLEGSVVFNNTYNTTQIDRTFMPQKVLTGREEPLKVGEFTFTLTPAGSFAMDQQAAEAYHNAASDDDKLSFLKRNDRSFAPDPDQPMPGNVTADNKVQNGESGAILINTITYTSDHMGGEAYGKVYKYTLSEDIPAGAVDGKADGIVYDTETRTLYVYVHLHKTGTGGALAVLGDTDTLVYADVLGDRNATFTNRYETTPVEVDFGDSDKNDNDDVDIALIKRITGRNFETGDSFTFTLAPATQNAPMPVNAAGAEVKEVTVRPDSGSSVEIPFGKITFEKAGVYTYTLKEKTGNLAGMAYDTEDREVTVTVTDNGRGQLTAVVNPESVTWINRYNSVDVDLGDSDKNDNDDVNVGLVKRIRGRNFKAGDSFTFTLTPATPDTPMPKDATGTVVNEVTVTPTSGSSVEIPFGKITFEEAGVYTYTLQENTGDLDKMTYDDGAKTITITVTENENGQLTAVADPRSVTWTNKYRTSGSKPDPDKKPGNDSGDSGSGGSGSDSGGSGGSGDTANAASASEAAPASAGGSALPQTGMLWWPVWILVIIGAVMLGVGIVRKKTSRGSHEE